jgi:SAM-dependent methyltransferase
LAGDRPEAFGERMAEVYDAWYGTRRADETTAASVEVLADLAAGGSVLELAIGTGRVALPLAARGLSVHGIDASEAMVAKLREKAGGEAIPVTIGDFADVGVDGAFDLVFLVFNTLFNLPSQEAQVRCFHNVARHLSPRGVFVVEAFVPRPADLADGQALRTVHLEADTAVLEAALHDPVDQRVHYQYIVVDTQGVRLHPVPMRYAWPSELDLMARLAGLELRARWAGWDRAPFTASSTSHVSVYGRAATASAS